MPVQLSLLEDETVAQSSSSLIWSQLPAHVRAELSARLAELLARTVRLSPIDEETANDALQAQADSSEP
jgi:hypothetical protein